MITRAQRAWVRIVLALLVVPGAIGFDAWPLTGWRLFSLARDATQTEWALDVEVGSVVEEVDLEQLPLAFRNAAWPMASLPAASRARRQAMCEALLRGVRAAAPDAAGLRLVREHRRMTVDDRDRVSIEEDREVVHRCG